MDRITNKLPGDPTAIVLSILSLILIFLGCCCGLFAFVSVVLSIIALVMAAKSIRQYALDPEGYEFKSYKTMNTAKILAIIGIVLGVLIMAGQAAFWIINGREATRDLWDAFENGRAQSQWEHWEDTDTIATGDANIILKKQGDSIVIDTTATQP